MLIFLFRFTPWRGEVRAVAPTGGLTGMSPLPDPNPACGFEWRAFTAGFDGAQGGMAHKMEGSAVYSKRSFSVVRI